MDTYILPNVYSARVLKNAFLFLIAVKNRDRCLEARAKHGDIESPFSLKANGVHKGVAR